MKPRNFQWVNQERVTARKNIFITRLHSANIQQLFNSNIQESTSLYVIPSAYALYIKEVSYPQRVRTSIQQHQQSFHVSRHTGNSKSFRGCPLVSFCKGKHFPPKSDYVIYFILQLILHVAQLFCQEPSGDFYRLPHTPNT